jgi:hypothetical protein
VTAAVAMVMVAAIPVGRYDDDRPLADMAAMAVVMAVAMGQDDAAAQRQGQQGQGRGSH